MIIIAHDNFDRDEISEQVIAKDVSQYYAEKIVEALNELPQQSWFYSVKPDDYKPYTWEP